MSDFSTIQKEPVISELHPRTKEMQERLRQLSEDFPIFEPTNLRLFFIILQIVLGIFIGMFVGNVILYFMLSV